MTAVALPAHLQGRASRNLSDKAVAFLGSSQPPHVSIRGNAFTLVDASGNEQDAGSTLECVVIDISDVNCKKYFPDEWKPDSNDAPACWSSNGVAPSRDASSPQAQTCAACPQNVRGSKISKISGASIKACRDEKWLALLLPAMNMMFQLVLTPGSFDNWKAYNQKFKNNGVDLDFVTTKISFVPKINGVLDFTATTFVTPEVTGLVDKALREKATDVLVGRNDVPRDPTLAAPQGQSAAPLPQIASAPAQAASPAAFQTNTAGPAAVDAPAESQKRKRRTNAEMAAATQLDERVPGPLGAAPTPAMAPFRPQAPAAPAGNGTFGMAEGVAPNAELEGALKSVFG